MGIFFCAYIFNQFLDLISNIDKKILSMLVSASFWFCSSRKIRSYFLDEVFLLQISSKLDYPSLLSMDGEQTHTLIYSCFKRLVFVIRAEFCPSLNSIAWVLHPPESTLQVFIWVCVIFSSVEFYEILFVTRLSKKAIVILCIFLVIV